MPIKIYFAMLAILFWTLLKPHYSRWKSIGVILAINLAGVVLFQILAAVQLGHVDKLILIAIVVQLTLGTLLGTAIYLAKRIFLRWQKKPSGSN